VLVPYPIVKILDDRFELYLDFHLVAETDSCSEAFALLLAMYHVFEIRFDHHNRCCRLLYGIVFEDAHFLNKSLKRYLNDWHYKMNNQPLIKRKQLVANLVKNLTQSSTMNENFSSSPSISNQVGFQI
jgi:hypothetical protein